jgi:hypothetical protein
MPVREFGLTTCISGGLFARSEPLGPLWNIAERSVGLEQPLIEQSAYGQRLPNALADF